MIGTNMTNIILIHRDKKTAAIATILVYIVEMIIRP